MRHRVIHIAVIMAVLTGANATPGSQAQAATIQLPRTGQISCYDALGKSISCYGTGQDGDKLKGAIWPVPRFTDNDNGTITDNLTGLIWLKNANCLDTVGGIAKGRGNLYWSDALTWTNSLAAGSCGLTDGSAAGDWRLPNIVELKSLADLSRYNPALPAGQLFENVRIDPNYFYWSSTNDGYIAWGVFMDDGFVGLYDKLDYDYVWPVRGGE